MSSECRDCGRPIEFKHLASGKWQPIEPATGEPHFHKTPKPDPLECPRCGDVSLLRIETPDGPHWAALRCEANNHFIKWISRPV